MGNKQKYKLFQYNNRIFATAGGDWKREHMPSHGGNTGSNPVGDANNCNGLDPAQATTAAMYGKNTAKASPDADGRGTDDGGFGHPARPVHRGRRDARSR
jgi:hypothetical protein